MTTRDGEFGTKEYVAWCSMRRRCRQPKDAKFHRYGGRGVEIDSRWDVYKNFLEDMGRKPSPQHSLDRIDTDGDYGPANCRWALPIVQQRNRSTNHVITFRGERKTLSEWAALYGLRPHTLLYRLNNGWSVAKAMTLPVR